MLASSTLAFILLIDINVQIRRHRSPFASHRPVRRTDADDVNYIQTAGHCHRGRHPSTRHRHQQSVSSTKLGLRRSLPPSHPHGSGTAQRSTDSHLRRITVDAIAWTPDRDAGFPSEREARLGLREGIERKGTQARRSHDHVCGPVPRHCPVHVRPVSNSPGNKAGATAQHSTHAEDKRGIVNSSSSVLAQHARVVSQHRDDGDKYSTQGHARRRGMFRS